MATQFSRVYNRFLGKITDDMYIELTPEDTLKDLQNLIIAALPEFEFPRHNIMDYTLMTEVIPENEASSDDFIVGVVWGKIPKRKGVSNTSQEIPDVIIDRSYFHEELTEEEINIIAILMMCNWVNRQVASIENTRMKYSGSDFKMTSQANHLAKLLNLLKETQRQSHHMQRLYRRRKRAANGGFESNWSILRENSVFDD